MFDFAINRKYDTDAVLRCMKIHGSDNGIQRIQTEHRFKLAKFWGIAPGERILEVGCGQCDTTAVLAELVGEDGFILAIDPAEPGCGAPVTLGEAASHLLASRLGKRLCILPGTSLARVDESDFSKVVLSHCAWYFASPEELDATFRLVRTKGECLCFAEWDSRIYRPAQQAHRIAVEILSRSGETCANVRTLFTPEEILRIASDAGWSAIRQETLNSRELQDPLWEIEHALSLPETPLHEKLHEALKHGSEGLSVFAFTAR